MLAFGFIVLIVASNRLLGLSAGTVASQLVLHRLLTVASSCCDGVVVVLDVVEVALSPPPPHETGKMVERAKQIKVIGFFIFDWTLIWKGGRK